MNYLAISKAPKFVAFAYFEDTTLKEVDVRYFSEYDNVLRVKEMYQVIRDLVFQYKPSVVITHSLEIQTVLKRDLERMTELRSMIKLVSIELKCLYLEARTNGWEKYIMNGRTTKARKTKIIKEAYNLDFDLDLVYVHEITDAIILGEAVAHKRLVL